MKIYEMPLLELHRLYAGAILTASTDAGWDEGNGESGGGSGDDALKEEGVLGTEDDA